jgi:hypothetical protein
MNGGNSFCRDGFKLLDLCRPEFTCLFPGVRYSRRCRGLGPAMTVGDISIEKLHSSLPIGRIFQNGYTDREE